ncbi:MAG: hypothetical protein HY329_06010 [Chloroflexi bacterium]|nr:hypothetical protein [Chloroflexota bacterium]
MTEQLGVSSAWIAAVGLWVIWTLRDRGIGDGPGEQAGWSRTRRAGDRLEVATPAVDSGERTTG